MKANRFPATAAFACMLGHALSGQNVLPKSTLPQEHWVATWAASPQARAGGPPRAAQPGATANPAGPNPAQASSFNNQTVRMIVRTSIGGSRVRVELSNAYGTAPLVIGAAHVALRVSGGATNPSSDRALTFGGKPSFSIPPGALAVSDPVNLAVPKLGDLAITVYFPKDTGPFTMHSTGLHTTYILSGDTTGIAVLGDVPTTRSWYFLSGVDVAAPADTGLIVAFGDSITDGATSTVDADRSWPSILAQRLLANPATANLAIVNQGISGNRVLREGTATNALARFDRDVLSQPGAKWVMLMEGINDIGHGSGEGIAPENAVTADDLIQGMKQLVERAHMGGMKAIGCTLTPFAGAAYYSDKGEEIRTAYNQWIRKGGVFDAVVDFDKAVQDPANPKQIRADYNIMDHLHPNDAGYKAMANAVDLSIFTRKR
ncbi:MAG TPA: SGNH/GDSL hydrolase family protein [Bryobacteraceae bacterium]